MIDYDRYLSEHSEEIFERLKEKLRLKKDNEVGTFLGFSDQAISHAKNKKMPISWLLRAHIEHSVDIGYTLFGEERGDFFTDDSTIIQLVQYLEELRRLSPTIYFETIAGVARTVTDLKNKATAKIYRIGNGT